MTLKVTNRKATGVMICSVNHGKFITGKAIVGKLNKKEKALDQGLIPDYATIN